MTHTLQAAASNIGKFANAGSDHIGAIQGALNMVAQFAALSGPKGHLQVQISKAYVDRLA